MKKIISLILCLLFAISLTACGRAMDDAKSDAESIADSAKNGAQSAIDRVTGDDASSNASGDKKRPMNLMAGITAKEATAAALAHAGLEESQVSDIDVDLDRDNGTLIYEVDFNSGNTEYDYDINAETGEVISADKSRE